MANPEHLAKLMEDVEAWNASIPAGQTVRLQGLSGRRNNEAEPVTPLRFIEI